MSFAVGLIVLATFGGSGASCTRLYPPVEALITAEYAPIGSYAGHWGIDFAVPPGTTVGSADAGTVTFAGSVAGRLSVTVAHGGGLRSSYSYLSGVSVRVGERLVRGSIVGTSGLAHGRPSVHFSVRVDVDYQDPLPWLQCSLIPGPALRLAVVHGWSVYPRRRATRHSRWNVRSSSYRSPVRRRVCLPGSEAGRCHFLACRCPLAKG